MLRYISTIEIEEAIRAVDPTPATCGLHPGTVDNLNTCKMEAARIFASERRSADPQADTAETAYVLECMEARGYRITLAPKLCVPEFPFATQEECWEPKTTIREALDNLAEADKRP